MDFQSYAAPVFKIAQLIGYRCERREEALQLHPLSSCNLLLRQPNRCEICCSKALSFPPLLHIKEGDWLLNLQAQDAGGKEKTSWEILQSISKVESITFITCFSCPIIVWLYLPNLLHFPVCRPPRLVSERLYSFLFFLASFLFFKPIYRYLIAALIPFLNLAFIKSEWTGVLIGISNKKSTIYVIILSCQLRDWWIVL